MLDLLIKRPQLHVRVLLGPMGFEINPRSTEELSQWLVAASTHVTRNRSPIRDREGYRSADPSPVQIRFHPSGYIEMGVDGVIGQPTWIRCTPLYVQGGDPVEFTLVLPAYTNDDGRPVHQRMIRL